jgi:hypothetical protein
MSDTNSTSEIHELWHPGVGVGHEYGTEMSTHFEEAGARIDYCEWGDGGSLDMTVSGISREEVLEAAKHCIEVMPRRKNTQNICVTQPL